jgi:hypothetical protein
MRKGRLVRKTKDRFQLQSYQNNWTKSLHKIPGTKKIGISTKRSTRYSKDTKSNSKNSLPSINRRRRRYVPPIEEPGFHALFPVLSVEGGASCSWCYKSAHVHAKYRSPAQAAWRSQNTDGSFRLSIPIPKQLLNSAISAVLFDIEIHCYYHYLSHSDFAR